MEQEANWYKPAPGEPYRPLIAMPDQLREKIGQISARFSSCTANFFTAFDPPHALAPASELLPAVPAGVPNSVPAPSPTQDPGNKDPGSIAAPNPLPPVVPTVDQPKATSKPDPVSDHGTSNPEPDPADPAAHETSQSQSQNSPKDPNTDPVDSSNPQQGPAPKGDTDPKQDSDISSNPEAQKDPGEPHAPPHRSQQQ